MDDFTAVSALIGGAMIGASASLLLLLTGRVAGISGILGRLLVPPARGTAWRAAFVAGLVLAPVAYRGLGGDLPPVTIGASFPLLVVAGLLVGFGARLGSGCTSGHGVCGIGRGSPRSLAATGTFMTVAILTVLVARRLVGA
ncbi:MULTISPECIES: YeeE/YedE family protein [Methylobacterium]|uniref:YeeE/YedE family protein n=1 Tax=Methylobacterium TaxID=407 RepID=UPI0003815FF1|nr:MULTISPECIES: YeeE/YedE family protein [Methylobacterium]MBN4098208.1 YeeE/YedE family protein [Methylobacterium sp. OT2]UIN38070.1 YeeE/YedE family protein [Methylobacterium oryzae]